MTVKDKIFNEIKHGGPISIERYMDLCLYDQEFGYYSRGETIGKKGDFITAPEISQTFGELLGLWLIQVWSEQAKNRAFNLIELGPGNGTLMQDILRVAKIVPEFISAASVYLIEKSEYLKSIQRERLSIHPINWVASINSTPDLPTFVIANEFLDALPVRQFIKIDGRWHERLVNLDNNNTLSFINLPTNFHKYLSILHYNFPDNNIIEVCDDAVLFIKSLASKIRKNGGSALFIDYGSFGGSGDTLQAVKDHNFIDPLSLPGECDLTTQVNFKNISETAVSNGVRVTNLLSQGDFLRSLGINECARVLAQRMRKKERELHFGSISRLVNKNEMGKLFKVLGITHKNSEALPGLEKL